MTVLPYVLQGLKKDRLKSTFSPQILWKLAVWNCKIFQISEQGGLNFTFKKKNGTKFYSWLKQEGPYSRAYLLTAFFFDNAVSITDNTQSTGDTFTNIDWL